MKKITRRVMSLALAVLLFAGMTAGVMAAGTIAPVKGTQTVYLTTKNAGQSRISFALASGTKSFTINRSGIKVTKGTTGAKLAGLYKNEARQTRTEEVRSASGKWKTYKSSWANCSYTGSLQVTGTGTATVKYKIGTTSYSTKVKVLAYRNPIKTITLTGVNGGANFASLTKNQLWPQRSLILSEKTAGAKLTVKPVTGWKVTEVELYDNTAYSYRRLYCSAGLSSMTLSCGTLDNTHNYEVYVEFVNTSNKATMATWYQVTGMDQGEEQPSI